MHYKDFINVHIKHQSTEERIKYNSCDIENMMEESK